MMMQPRKLHIAPGVIKLDRELQVRAAPGYVCVVAHSSCPICGWVGLSYRCEMCARRSISL